MIFEIFFLRECREEEKREPEEWTEDEAEPEHRWHLHFSQVSETLIVSSHSIEWRGSVGKGHGF